MRQRNNDIPEEIRQLKLCQALRDCGAGVETNFKQSKSVELEVYDSEELRYSDWSEGFSQRTDVLHLHNKQAKNTVLLPLDNKIISGEKTKKGGVADCAILTKESFSFVEFKTNVSSNTEQNIKDRTDSAIKQLWHTYNEIVSPRCKDKGIEMGEVVEIDFNIVFNTALDVTGTMATRQNQQIEFLLEKGFPLYFDNDKKV